MNKGFTPTSSLVSLESVSNIFLNKFKNIKKLFSKTFINSTTKIQHKTWCRGFTLIETMVAVLILSTSVVSLLALTTGSLFAARYANNEITANYLMQEAVDYIRNSRDSIAFQQRVLGDNPSVSWSAFLNRYGDGISSSCYSTDGCYIEVMSSDQPNAIQPCISAVTFGSSKCPVLNYDEAATNKSFYTYGSNGAPSKFKRKIYMQKSPTNPNNEVYVTVTIEWLNGNLLRTRSLSTSLLDWQA